MKARLFCPVGKFAGRTIDFENEVVVGRKSGPPKALVLSDNRISAEHARIHWDPEEACYFLEDLESTNGTILAGVRVESRQRLARLDVIDFGGVSRFIFQVLTEAAETVPETDPTTDLEEGARTSIEEGAVPLPRFPDVGGADPTRKEDAPPPLPSLPDSGDADLTRREDAPSPLPPDLGGREGTEDG